MEDAHVQATIDAFVAHFYSFFDNRGGAMPRLADVMKCFSGVDVYTVGEFVLPRIELLSAGALLQFHEWETSATTQLFDGIATRTSRYSKSGLLDGRDYSGSGTKCFQLVELDSGWRIAALAWVDDRA